MSKELVTTNREMQKGPELPLIGRRIGPWMVVEKRPRSQTRSGRRAVYVVRHDGHTKGVRRSRIGAFIRAHA